MSTKKKTEERTSALDVFGITEKEADDIIKKIRHLEIEGANMTDIVHALDIDASGQLGFKCYAFGRLVAQNEDNHKTSQIAKQLGLE